MDIHLEKGMHCVDCHFVQDVHGNTKLYGEVRAAIEIQCIDCHGTLDAAADAAHLRPGRVHVAARRRPRPVGRCARRSASGGSSARRQAHPELDGREGPALGSRRRSTDTIDPGASRTTTSKSHLAKTVRFERRRQDRLGRRARGERKRCAHANENMSCIACHSSWNPSCFGCHLPQKANMKMPSLHNEGDVTRNYVAYNFQTLRDDVFMLARDGNVTGNRIGPARSSCAIHVGSYNDNRESIYVQQQTISGDGLSGIAFSTNVPHTVRGGPHTGVGSSASAARAKPRCAPTATSPKHNDNNAIMAQLLMQGTNYVNFIGRYCWVAAGEHGFEARRRHRAGRAAGGHRQHAAPAGLPGLLSRSTSSTAASWSTPTSIRARTSASNSCIRSRSRRFSSLQARGEYLYAACGDGGLRVFDIAFIDDKGFSERITTAPVSPLGQQFYVPTKYATAVAAPTTIAPDPTRMQHPENQEQAVHPLYGYIYVADKYEGLILVGAGTLLDGNPLNNFLERE